MASALSPEVIFWTFFELPCVLVPSDSGIIKGQLAFKGRRMPLIHFNASDAFGEVNLVN